MNDSTWLINIHDCAEKAGVTEDTIRQYAEFGFLDAIHEGNELFFKERDIENIFGFSGFYKLASKVENEADGEPSAVPVREMMDEGDLASRIEVKKDETTGPYDQSSSLKLLREKVVARSRKTGQPLGKGMGARTERPAEQETGLVSALEVEQVVGQPESKRHSVADDLVDSNAYELMAVNRRLREEVRYLREERDWLRERLEKLEMRSERDQMLMLSESETIRGLVHSSGQRRSFWSYALPWLKPEKM